MAQMANVKQQNPATRVVTVRELVVRATEETLNEAFAEHGIQPDRILSIMWQPGGVMAIGD